MNLEILFYAAIGGLVPDAIRILKWSRTAKAKRGKNPLGDSATYVGLVIQILLGLLASSVLVVTTPLQAMAAGYAAPDILTRVFSSISRSEVSKLGAAATPDRSFIDRLVSWWDI